MYYPQELATEVVAEQENYWGMWNLNSSLACFGNASLHKSELVYELHNYTS